MTTKTTFENGQALTPVPAYIDIKEKNKKDMEIDLEKLRYNILDVSKRHEKAFTEDERRFIINRLKMLEYNYKVLRNRYDELYGFQVLQEIAAGTLLDADGHYNVDDPEVRKRIGRGLSYSSGTLGYTQKETEALKELIPDLEDPVIF